MGAFLPLCNNWDIYVSEAFLSVFPYRLLGGGGMPRERSLKVLGDMIFVERCA